MFRIIQINSQLIGLQNKTGKSCKTQNIFHLKIIY